MSRLDSSVQQILGTGSFGDGDGRRRAYIDYISAQPKPVRDALLIPDDTTDPRPATRQAALIKLAKGFPKRGYQIDPEIMLQDEGNPLVVMRDYRQAAGLPWVPAYGMDPLPASGTGIAAADPNNIPPGAIVTVTSWSPAEDLMISVKPFKWLAARSPGSNPPGNHAPHDIGSCWWPIEGGDDSGELAFFTDLEEGGTYQKLSVIHDGAGGVGQLQWVRLS